MSTFSFSSIDNHGIPFWFLLTQLINAFSYQDIVINACYYNYHVILFFTSQSFEDDSKARLFYHINGNILSSKYSISLDCLKIWDLAS